MCVLLLDYKNAFRRRGGPVQPVRTVKKARPMEANSQLGDLFPAAAMLLMWLAWVGACRG